MRVAVCCCTFLPVSFVVVCCSVLQRVAVCCSVLQCVILRQCACPAECFKSQLSTQLTIQITLRSDFRKEKNLGKEDVFADFADLITVSDMTHSYV